MSDGNGRWATSSFSRTEHCRTARCNRSKRSSTYSFDSRRRMIPNPALGVFFHWLGGLASASFYVPYRGVKSWAWETYWLVGGFFSWIIAPWLLATFLTRDLRQVLSEAPSQTIFWAIFFGLLWGLGGLTFGLTMRYLGMSLGMAVVLGLCAAFGTL